MTKETTYTNSRDNADTKTLHDLQISLHEVETHIHEIKRDIYKLKRDLAVTNHNSTAINVNAPRLKVAQLIRDELLVRIQEQLSSFSDETLVKLAEEKWVQ